MIFLQVLYDNYPEYYETYSALLMNILTGYYDSYVVPYLPTVYEQYFYYRDEAIFYYFYWVRYAINYIDQFFINV